MLEIFTMGDLRWSLCDGESGWFHGSTICTHGVFRQMEAYEHTKCLHLRWKSSKEMAASNYFHFIRKEPVRFQGRYLAQGHRVSKPELLDLNSVLFLHLTASSEEGFRFLERLGPGEGKSPVTAPGVADTGTFVPRQGLASSFAFLSVICCTWRCCRVVTSQQCLLEQHWTFTLVCVVTAALTTDIHRTLPMRQALCLILSIALSHSALQPLTRIKFLIWKWFWPSYLGQKMHFPLLMRADSESTASRPRWCA